MHANGERTCPERSRGSRTTFAAVMTGKGTGAIATIQICGDSANDVIEKIFRPNSARPGDFRCRKARSAPYGTCCAVGKIRVGTITDGAHTIDQVTIGCESADAFAINCHGNPLLAERIMQLLKQQGVELITAGQLLVKTSTISNTIALEAKLTIPKVKTIEGTSIILNQIDSGLTAVAKKWLISPLNKIIADAKEIIKSSQPAKFLVFGCRIVLAGPPNSGKSTLLNRLCGKQKAIVTNVKGATRDWVSAQCRIGPLAVELIDTAGLDENLKDNIDVAAKKAALEMINHADLILLVLDNSVGAEQLTNGLIKSTAGKKILAVINKSDLPARFDTTKLSDNLACCIVQISALQGTGIDALVKKICEITGIDNFDLQQPICFTSRQDELVTALPNTRSQEKARTIITELLSGRLTV